MSSLTRAAATVNRALGSVWFLWVIAVVFATSALTIALTAKPQLLYDEYYHFGIIQLYTKQLSPFFSSQSPDTASLGDVTRLGSFLYQYLLSFPARLMVHGGAPIETQFRVLRTITVMMTAVSLYWFRRCLVDSGLSGAVANTAIAVFCSLPISSFLAATINYDNLLILLAAIHLSLGVRIYVDRRRTLAFYLAFLATGVLACLTKYEFLPVFVATVIILAVRYALTRRAQPLPHGLPLLGVATPGSIAKLVTAGVVLLAATAVFVDRYVVNLLRYGSPNPDCGDLHSVRFCTQYGPWGRDYLLQKAHPTPTPLGWHVIGQYLPQWVTNMLTTVHVDGVQKWAYAGPDAYSSLLSYAVPTAIVILAIGFGFVVRRLGFQFLFIAGGFYVAVLFHTEFSYYLRIGQANAISARYVMFFVPVFLGAVGFALATIVRRLYPIHGPLINLTVFLVLAVLSLDGGWFTTFMIGATPEWFDPSSPLMPVLGWLRSLSSHLVVH